MTTSAPALDVAPSQRLWRLSSWLLNNAASRANRLVSHFGGPGVRIRYAVLAGLDEFGPISQAELGRRLGIDRSDIVGVLNDLEYEGFALRAPDPEDRRRNAIQITTDGSLALHALDGQIDAAQAALLEPLTADERVQLDRLLQQLLRHHAGYRPDQGKAELPGHSRSGN